jgi:hypothetical protein
MLLIISFIQFSHFFSEIRGSYYAVQQFVYQLCDGLVNRTKTTGTESRSLAGHYTPSKSASSNTCSGAEISQQDVNVTANNAKTLKKNAFRLHYFLCFHYCTLNIITIHLQN